MEKKIVFQMLEDFVEIIRYLPFSRLTPFHAFWANLVFKTNKVQDKFNYLFPKKIKYYNCCPCIILPFRTLTSQPRLSWPYGLERRL